VQFHCKDLERSTQLENAEDVVEILDCHGRLPRE
jgi:hypothetical protein